MDVPLEETVELTPLGVGARVTLRTRGPRGKSARQAWASMQEQYAEFMSRIYAQLAALLRKDASSQASAPEANQ